MDDATGSDRTAGQRAGDAAEELVASRLAAAGWTIVARNVRVGRRELDILAIDPGPPRALVIVEVRWRSRRDFGLPEETVDWQKRRRLREAAFGLLERGLVGEEQLPQLALRFDLVVVEPAPRRGEPPRIRHHRNAIEGG